MSSPGWPGKTLATGSPVASTPHTTGSRHRLSGRVCPTRGDVVGGPMGMTACGATRCRVARGGGGTAMAGAPPGVAVVLAHGPPGVAGAPPGVAGSPPDSPPGAPPGVAGSPPDSPPGAPPVVAGSPPD